MKLNEVIKCAKYLYIFDIAQHSAYFFIKYLNYANLFIEKRRNIQTSSKLGKKECYGENNQLAK